MQTVQILISSESSVLFCDWYSYLQKWMCPNSIPEEFILDTPQLAFYVNLHRAVIGPSATLTGRWRPDKDLRRMLTGSGMKVEYVWRLCKSQYCWWYCTFYTGKKCRPRSDAAERVVWSGSTLFTFNTGISIINELAHDKTYNKTWVTSKDSD